MSAPKFVILDTVYETRSAGEAPQAQVLQSSNAKGCQSDNMTTISYRRVTVIQEATQKTERRNNQVGAGRHTSIICGAGYLFVSV